MKQLMAFVMLALAAGFMIPVAVHAAETGETQVSASADAEVATTAVGVDATLTAETDDDDGTDDQGSGDADGTESSDDDDESGDDDGTDDQGSGDADGTERSEEGDDDEETSRQVADMETGIGAQVRLLQLKREIERNALRMDAVIAVIDDSNSSNATDADVKSLESIAAELRLLKGDVDSALNNTTNKEASVQAFLDIKADAKDLVKQFRETARPLLSDADMAALKAKFQGIERDELKDITDEVQKARREWAADRIEAVLKAGGIVDAELVAKVRSGEISVDEARKQIKDRLHRIEKDLKERLKDTLKESEVKRNVFKQDVVLRLREKELERREDRSGKRAEELEKRGLEGASDRLKERSDRLGERADDLEKRREELEKRLANEREKRRSGSDDTDDSADDNSGSSSDDDSEDDVQ